MRSDDRTGDGHRPARLRRPRLSSSHFLCVLRSAGEALARAASAAAWSTSPHVSPARSRSLTGEQLPPLAMDRIFADPVAAMAAGSALTSPTAASASALLQQAPTGVARSPKAAGAGACSHRFLHLTVRCIACE